MSSAEKQERRNTSLFITGFAVMFFGAVIATVGVFYTLLIDGLDNPLPSILAVDDSVIRFLGTRSYEITTTGLALLCLGALLKWRAETWQRALERTNRPVSYDTLMAKRGTRRFQ